MISSFDLPSIHWGVYLNSTEDVYDVIALSMTSSPLDSNQYSSFRHVRYQFSSLCVTKLRDRIITRVLLVNMLSSVDVKWSYEELVGIITIV